MSNNIKDGLLHQAADWMQKNDSGYQQFAHHRAEIRDLYEGYFLHRDGINRFVQQVNDDFVTQLQKLPIADGTIEQNYNWGYIVTLYHNSDDVAGAAKAEIEMQDFCRSAAFDFVPDNVKQDASPNAIEAYLIDPFSPNTAIGRQLISQLSNQGYTVILKDADDYEVTGFDEYPITLSIKMAFTKNDIGQLHRIAGRV